MRVVSDSSPLIALARIQQLDLFPAIFESVLIPPAVASEIALSVPVVPPWLQVRVLAELRIQPPLRRRLGDGEREAIALALELEAHRIVLDDLPARRVANAAGLNVVGTLGILLGAKRAGLIKLLRPELDNLLRTSFFLSPQLYNRLVKESGEENP